MNVFATGADPERPSVLVVDDEHMMCMLAEAALGEAGFAVETVENGEAALELLETFRPDLILLDVLLPGIDGISLCRQLCADPRTCEIPICIMTGLGDRDSIQRAYDAGATDFIVKPPAWPILIQHLRHLLRSSRTTRELTLANIRLQHEISERERAEAELRKLTQAVEQSANIIIVTDSEGRIEYVNPRFVQNTGYSLAEALGQTPRIVKSGEHGPEFYKDLWETIKAGKVWKGELHNRRKDGSRYWEDTTITPIFDPAGDLVNFMAVKEDVTARKALEQAEREQRQLAEALRDTAAAVNSTLQLEELLDRILDNIGKIAVYDAVFIVMLEGDGARLVRHRGTPLVRAADGPGPVHYRLTDLPLLGPLLDARKPCFILDTVDDPACVSGCRMIPGTRSCLGIPLEIRGSVMGAVVLTSVTPGRFTADSAQRLRAFASQASVAIENAQFFQQVQRLSVTDELTGLNNRRHFFSLAKLEYERTRRYGGTLSVVLLDIDSFKIFNDTYGHLVGDAVLCEVARRIQEAVRTIDVVARYGGEEFVVLMPETDLAEAALVAERVRRSVAESPVIDDEVEATATVSVGVAEINERCVSVEDVLKSADQALYAAKSAGRNRVETGSCIAS
ncbi:MAG: diguanylate cyclase [Candidatus Methylomirabilia bacterium]